MNRNYLLFVFVGIAVLVLLTSLLFDVKRVPDYSRVNAFDFEGSDPFDFSGFKELLVEAFDQENVTVIKEIEKMEMNTSGSQLLIIVSSKIKLEYRFVKKFLAKENRLLLIANQLEITTEADSSIEESLGLPYRLFNHVEFFKDTCLDIVYPDLIKQDSITEQFCYYEKEFDRPQSFNFSYLVSDNYTYTTLSSIDTLGNLAVLWNTNLSGQLMVHTNPSMFNNLGIRQPFFLPYFNYLLANITAEKVYLTSNSILGDSIPESKNPFQYILSQDGLKHAYYTIVGLLILYIFYGSKRKQKAIPVIKKLKNTSLSYVDVLSKLYIAQNQNEKLIKRLEHQFSHFCKSKYYLDAKDEDFIKKLSKKSGVEAMQLEKIIGNFKNVNKGVLYNDQQLYDVNALLEYFYSNCK